jgi:hypothetical protein
MDAFSVVSAPIGPRRSIQWDMFAADLASLGGGKRFVDEPATIAPTVLPSQHSTVMAFAETTGRARTLRPAHHIFQQCACPCGLLGVERLARPPPDPATDRDDASTRGGKRETHHATVCPVATFLDKSTAGQYAKRLRNRAFGELQELGDRRRGVTQPVAACQVLECRALDWLQGTVTITVAVDISPQQITKTLDHTVEPVGGHGQMVSEPYRLD